MLKEFKYLGHMITDNLTDDADIQREVRNLFVRANYLDVDFTNVLWL